MFFRSVRQPARRCMSSLSQKERDNINSWVQSHPLPARQALSRDHITPSRLDALRCTLPTLDGSLPSPHHRSPGALIEDGSPLRPGHHLIFCNPPVAERHLNADATSSLLRPPAPLTRRMWSGGRFQFQHPIHVGDSITAEASISRIDVKRLDSEHPMMVVEQRIETRLAGDGAKADACVVEMRSHVYVPVAKDSERRVRVVKDLPNPDFSLSYTPTDTMLFRFSALTFNSHRVHLYKEYAQEVEKLPERLVHGPMTALMLLETMEFNKPEHSAIHTFEYRATNPLFVNRRITIHGTWLSDEEVKLWAQGDDGIVGMIGEVHLKNNSRT